MKRYLWLPVLIVAMLVVLFVGCKKGNDTPIAPDNSVDVTVATDAVYQSMKNACSIDGVEELYFAFDVKTSRPGEYATIVNFAALVDISAANVQDDHNSRLSFAVSQDVVGTKSLEVYYADGTLYLNYPPLVNRAAIDGLSLGSIAKTLYGSYTSGAIHTLAEMLPAVGNRVFAGCEKTTQGSFNTYTFAFDYEAFWSMLTEICQASDLGITRGELAGILGWDSEIIKEKSALDTTISFVTESKSGEEIFRTATLNSKEEDDDRLTIDMTRWSSTVVTDVNRDRCQVTLPDGRSSFGTYHPLNLDLEGTLTIDVTGSESVDQRLGGISVTTRLTKQQYVFDYALKSNYQEGALSLLLSLTAEGKTMQFYLADGIVYVNLDELGLGVWKLPVGTLDTKLKALGYRGIDTAWESQDVVDLLVDLASDRVKTGDLTRLSLDGHGFDLLWRKVAASMGFDIEPLVEIDGLNLSLSSANNKFASLDATLSVWGSRATLTAASPKVGAPVAISRPAWASQAVTAFDTASTFVLEGTVKSSTNLSGNTKLVEALIESLSGDRINLGNREISRYAAETEWSKTGELVACKIDFSDVSFSPVCSLYYTNASPDELYVLYPAVGGVTHVTTHKVATANRFMRFVNAINGNAAVSELADCTLVNTSHGLSFTWSQAGINALLTHLHKVLPDLPTSLDDDFGLESLRLNLTEEGGARLSFGQGYIDLAITHLATEHYSLALTGTTLSGRNITLLDDNDLPTSVTLTMPNQEGGQSIRFAVDEWTYDNLSAISAGGTVAVTATTKVLGQTVSMVLNTDCTLPSGSGLSVYGDTLFETSYAQYLEGNVFTFARYNAPVDPFTVLQHFDKASVRIGNKTYSDRKVIWYCGTKPLSSVEFDGPQDSIAIVPYISTFFGTDLRLGDGYVIVLSGAKATGVEESDLFLTIAAYRNQSDPFDEATYAVKTPVFTLADGQTTTVNAVLWKVDSIRNDNLRQGSTNVRNADAVNLLDQALYSLSGTYKIDLAVVDCLGVESRFEVKIGVEPRVFDVSNMSFGGLLEGVSYRDGTFEIRPLTLDKVGITTSLAKSVSATFGEEEVRLTAISWNIPAANVNVLEGKEGLFGITFGNEVGGLQQVEGLTYVVTTLDATTVSIIGKEGAVLATLPTYVEGERQDAYQFSLTHLSAYEYQYPTYVRLSTGGEHFDKEVTYAPIGWDDTALWYDTSIFSDTFAFFGLEISIEMQFDQKVVDTWAFETLHGDVVWQAPLYLSSDDGEFVVVGNRYVAYDPDEEAHQGLRRYNLSEQVYDVSYRKVSEADQDVKRLILDPNNVNFHCLECYPDHVRVTFLDGTSASVKVVWPITSLDDVTVEDGFRNTLVLTLPDGQELSPSVGLWIASAKPTAVYTSVDYTYTEALDGEYVWFNNDYIPYDQALHQGRQRYARTIATHIVDGDERVQGSTTLQIALFDLVADQLIRNDPTDLETIHDLLCDRDDFEAGCLGDLYFEYLGETDVDSGWFAITQWENLSHVLSYFAGQVANGRGVQDVAGSVNIVAKVHDVECVIPLVIVASTMTDITLTAIPYANSSLGNAGQSLESMTADGTTLTVDPYIANPCVATSYPTRISFTLKGTDSVTTAIDGWDLSAIENCVPYEGGTFTVYALLHTAIDIDVRIPVTVKVLSREIEQVFDTDGKPLAGVVTVDVYSTSPFGQNLLVQNGRTLAYRNVLVKFGEDDLLYRMLLRYDITDYVASFNGGVLGQNVTVAVGNDAGGYQTLTGYNVYAEGAVILSVTTDNPAVLDYVNDGVLYDVNRAAKFVSFQPKEDGDEARRAAAWEALTLRVTTLTVTVGTSGGVQHVLTATLGAKEGVAFGWDRTASDEMCLTLVNNNTLFAGHLDSLQSIGTGSTRKISLTSDMFNLGALAVDFFLTFEADYTLADFLAEYKIKPQSTVIFEADQIQIEVLRGEAACDLDDLLVAGQYTAVITVDNPQYGGQVEIDFEVRQATIAQEDITVSEGNRTLSAWGGVSRLWTGYNLSLSATCTEGVELALTYYRGDQLLDEEPTDVGDYTVKLVSVDPNYKTEAFFVLSILDPEE